MDLMICYERTMNYLLFASGKMIWV